MGDMDAAHAEATKRAAGRGVLWTMTSHLSQQALRFCIGVVLARLLMPEQFGLLSMAMLFVAVAQLIADLGLGSALIQRSEVTRVHEGTAFAACTILGVLLAGVCWLSAPLAVLFFHEPEVGRIVRIVALLFIIDGLGAVPCSLLARRLEFKKLAFVEITLAGLSGAISIPLALNGYGVWSLVYPLVLLSALGVMLRYILSGWRPVFAWSTPAFRELMSFGGFMAGRTVVGFFSSSLDYWMTGRLLGAQSLGFYTRSFEIVNFPRQRLASIITRVTFPAFSRIQNDDARIRSWYLAAVKTISLISVPALAGLFLVSHEFVLVVFSEKWLPAVTPMRILCLLGILTSLGTTVGSVISAKGRPHAEMGFNAAMLAAMALAIPIGARHGIEGVAVAVLITAIPFWFLMQRYTNRLIGMQWGEYFRALEPAASGTVVMALAVESWRLLCIHLLQRDGVVLLAGGVTTGVLVYGAILVVRQRAFVGRLLGIIRPQGHGEPVA